MGWVGVLPVSLYNHILSTCPGKGRGRQVIAVARTADVVVMMLDATRGDVQRSAGWGGPTCQGKPLGVAVAPQGSS